MSRIRADKIANKDGTGAVQLQYGAEVPVGYGITGAGTINLNGNIQSANLSGGGAGITNINATNISSGTLAAARVATLNQNTSGTSGGLTGTPDITVNNVVAAAATFSGNVSIGGTLTYEDVTNIDSVGLITARGGIDCNGVIDVDGVATFSGNAILNGDFHLNASGTPNRDVFWDSSESILRFYNSAKATFGNSDPLQIYHDGSHSRIYNSTGNLSFKSAAYIFNNAAGNENLATFTEDTGVSLYDGANTVRLATNNTGAVVTGICTATGGISLPTVNTYIKGNGSNSVLQVDATRTYFYGGSDGIQVRKADNSAAIIIVDDSGNTNVAGGLSIGPGVLAEKFHNDTGGGITSNYSHSILTYGMVWYGSTNASGAWTFNVQGNGSTTLNSLMAIGETTTMTMYSANNNTANYMTAFKIDGSTITVKWAGGSAPSAATGSGTDVYAMTIMKTGNATFTVFGNFTNFA